MSYGLYIGKNLTSDGHAWLAGYGDEPSSHWLEMIPKKKHKNYVKYDKENFKDIDIKLIVDNFEDAKKIGRHNSNKIIKFINGVQKKVKK